MLTQERLRTLFDYDPSTGFLTRRTNRGPSRAGSVAGSFNSGHGYNQVMVDGKSYLMHRLIWFFVYGEWPKNRIDHINHDQTDNRIGNLRECNASQNGANTRRYKNNTSGFKGVYFNRRSNKWVATITENQKRKYVGSFDCPEVAHQAYCRETLRVNGAFAHFGK